MLLCSVTACAYGWGRTDLALQTLTLPPIKFKTKKRHNTHFSSIKRQNFHQFVEQNMKKKKTTKTIYAYPTSHKILDTPLNRELEHKIQNYCVTLHNGRMIRNRMALCNNHVVYYNLHVDKLEIYFPNLPSYQPRTFCDCLRKPIHKTMLLLTLKRLKQT